MRNGIYLVLQQGAYLQGALLLQVLGQAVQELEGVEVVLALQALAVDDQCQVLGHIASLDGLDADSLQLLGKLLQCNVVIDLGTELETAGPGKDGGDGVGGGLAALLVLAVVAGDGAVGSLGLAALAVGGEEDRGHKAEGSVALSNDIGLNITIVVLAGPNEPSRGLEHLGDHVVDQAVLVPDLLGLELLLVVALVDLLKDILEASIVLLQNGVLGGHVEGV